MARRHARAVDHPPEHFQALLLLWLRRHRVLGPALTIKEAITDDNREAAGLPRREDPRRPA